MNAIHITSFLSDRGGGIPPVIWGLSRGLGETGVSCIVAGLGEKPVECKPGVAGILSAPNRGLFGYSPALAAKIDRAINGDTVVHTHGLWTYPGIIARKAAAKASVPLIISAHGMLDAWALRNSALKKRIAGLLFERRNLRSAACLHALCESEAESYRACGLRNPICIIPNGIDLPSAQNSRAVVNNAPWSGTIKAGKKVLLYLGRIHPKKGLENLVRAWAATRQSSWVLAIAGWDQGGHEAELKSVCLELGVPFAEAEARERAAHSEASIFFLGPQFGKAKAACYANCDAFILPSFSEGLPMVVLEAWAYGKPVLMTPRCNLPAGYAAGAALKIEPDVQSITEGLRSLVGSSAQCLGSMGLNGQALIAGRFNWRSCAQDLAEVYSWLLGGGPRPGTVISD